MNFKILFYAVALINLPLVSLQAHELSSEGDSGNKWEELLGFPPEAGSIEEEEDVAVLLDFQSNRTEVECEDAAKEEKVSLKNFFGGEKGPLSKKEVKKLQLFFFKYLIKSGISGALAKFHFRRPRPFVTFPQIEPCIKMPSGLSYPSGHVTVSRLMAYALSLKFPERRDLFFQRADEIAMHRMLGGVHYPTDVRAGKVLADYLAQKYFGDEEFVEALAGQ